MLHYYSCSQVYLNLVRCRNKMYKTKDNNYMLNKTNFVSINNRTRIEFNFTWPNPTLKLNFANDSIWSRQFLIYSIYS